MNIAPQGEMTDTPRGDGADDFPAESAQGTVHSSIRALLLASVGSAFEFYDFVVSSFSPRKRPQALEEAQMTTRSRILLVLLPPEINLEFPFMRSLKNV